MQNDCIMLLKVKVQILTFREKGATFLALGKTHIWHYFSIICTEFVLRGAKNLGQFVREKSDIIFFDVYGIQFDRNYKAGPPGRREWKGVGGTGSRRRSKSTQTEMKHNAWQDGKKL